MFFILVPEPDDRDSNTKVVIVLASAGARIHRHALQIMDGQFQPGELRNCHLGKPHRRSEITSR
jgi:hypothetical protein